MLFALLDAPKSTSERLSVCDFFEVSVEVVDRVPKVCVYDALLQLNNG